MFGVNYKPLVLLHLAMQQLLDLLEPLIFRKISHLDDQACAESRNSVGSDVALLTSLMRSRMVGH
jgi:hypothetical protein